MMETRRPRLTDGRGRAHGVAAAHPRPPDPATHTGAPQRRPPAPTRAYTHVHTETHPHTEDFRMHEFAPWA
jgi:hypothetical protein